MSLPGTDATAAALDPGHAFPVAVRVAMAVATVVAPAILRTLPGAGSEHLVLAVASALALGARSGDTGVRHRCRRWLRDCVLSGAAVLALTLVWSSRRTAALEPGAVIALSLLLASALAEEVVYRGWIPQALSPASPAPPSCATEARREWTRTAVLSSLVFAAAHPAALGPDADIANVVRHFGVGLSLFALRGRDGSIVAPALAHTGYNAAVTLAMQ